jgi:hypothetical protein
VKYFSLASSDSRDAYELDSVRPGDELDRCAREQAEILRDAELKQSPAWLVTLGFEDWEREKELLLVGRSQIDGATKPTEAKT